MRRLVAFGSAFLVSVGWLTGVGAQEATPVTGGGLPVPAECLAEPRSPASPQAAAGTPVTDATASALAEGMPADPETIAAITDTVHEAIACFSTGEAQRALALFSDDFLRRHGADPAAIADLVAFVVEPPLPAPPEERQAILAFQDVRELPDGRVAAAVVTSLAGTPVPAGAATVVFVRQDDRWLIDEVIAGGPTDALGTPAPQ